ncbi:hypothetical protein ACGFJ4_16545 [Micromonospora chalcea]|uniref:hypothetical protein n=1 Tax=Micromonospora chalcea TaxID=1874 RepID=UPI00371F7D03
MQPDECAFCTEPRSGWVTYHLAARSTRTSGLFDQVTTWSLLYANALVGRVHIDEVAGFSRDRRRDFAARVAAVPEDTDLGQAGVSVGYPPRSGERHFLVVR